MRVQYIHTFMFWIIVLLKSVAIGGNVLVANGKKVSLRMFSTYNYFLIIPVNSNISVAPRFEVPAHT